MSSPLGVGPGKVLSQDKIVIPIRNMRKAKASSSGAPVATQVSSNSSLAMILHKKEPEQILEEVKPVIYRLVTNFEIKKAGILKKNDVTVTDDDYRDYYQQFLDSLGSDDARKNLKDVIEGYYSKGIEELSGRQLIEAINRSSHQYIGEEKPSQEEFARRESQSPQEEDEDFGDEFNDYDFRD